METTVYGFIVAIIVFKCIQTKSLMLILFLYRNDDLKEMLESNKESLKLDAMKRVVEVRVNHNIPKFRTFQINVGYFTKWAKQVKDRSLSFNISSQVWFSQHWAGSV